MERNFTQFQLDFLRTFFYENNSNYAGWINLADALLKHGKCIVAGNNCIWVGGIGNFITTKPAENAVDCIEYTFNYEEFTKSELYLSALREHIMRISESKKAIEQQYSEISNLHLV
jgi:hypothetical protein